MRMYSESVREVNFSMANREELKMRIANQLGIQFGSKQHNRNLTAIQCGRVGGEMVREALRQAGFIEK